MDNRKKVPLKNKLAYGIGTGGGNVFSQIAAAFLLNYYTDTALIGAGAIATMFLVCRVFDGITDLLMGGIVDKTSTKLGKARPWLIASAPLSFLGIVLLMNVPMGLGENGKLVYAYITYIFMSCIVYTIYGISNTALLPLMTHDKDDSTMLATFSALGNNIIGLIAGSLITPLVLNLGWKTSSIILGFAACVLILISGLLNKEMGNDEDTKKMAGIPMSQQLPATLKNKYFWLLLLLGAFSLIMNANAIGAQIYYCNMVLGKPMFMSALMTAGQLPGIFILFLMPAVSKKWNKKTFLLMGAVLIIVGFVITGIAGKRGFCSVNIEKDMMNSEIGFGRRILQAFEDNGISFEHVPSGIDTMTVFVHQDEFMDKEQNVVAAIHRLAKPDMIDIEGDLALIAVVGRGMRSTRGTAGRIFSALAHANINVKMIDQGSSELNIIIGVSDGDFENAIRAIYNMFVLVQL